jgi:hypothetical protein
MLQADEQTRMHSTLKLDIPGLSCKTIVPVSLPLTQCGQPLQFTGLTLGEHAKLPTPPRSKSPGSSPSRSSYTTSTPDSFHQRSRERRHSDASNYPSWRRRGSNTSDLVFSRRSYEELYTERAYLSSALQTQTTKAASLQWQYSVVQENLENATANRERRRLRKQLKYLESKLNDATDQKKALLVRLSELCIEIQSHETWSLAEQERISRQGTPASETGSCYFALSAALRGSSAPTTPLNGASPEFVPRLSAPAVQVSWSASESWPMDRTGRSNSLGALAELERVDEGDEDFMCNHDLEYRYCECDENLLDSSSRGYCSGGETPKKLRERRLSVPTLETLWPGLECVDK